MPPFNQSAWDVFEELHGASGQPDHEVVAGTDWVVVGGGGGCGLVVLLAMLLVVKKKTELVRDILERVSSLLTICVTALRTRVHGPTPSTTAPAPAPPNGRNFTDSFLVQWYSRAENARMSYL